MTKAELAEEYLREQQKYHEYKQSLLARNAERRRQGADGIVHRPTLHCRKVWGGWIVLALIALVFVCAAFALAGGAE